MDRRTLLAMILCLLIFLGWQKFFVEPHLNSSSQSSIQSQTVSPETHHATQNNSQTTPPGKSQTELLISKNIPPKELKLVNGTGDAILGNGGSFVIDWNLKSYKLDISPQAARVDLQSVTHQKGQLSLAFDNPIYTYLNDVRGNLVSTPEGALWTYEDSQVKLTREFKTSDTQPYIDLKITADFKNTPPKYTFLSIVAESFEKDPEAQDRQLVYFTNQSIERVHLKDSTEQKAVLTPTKYIGAANRYFVFSIIDQNTTAPTGLIQSAGGTAGRASLVYPISGNSITVPVKVYFGPKELELLRRVEPTLDHTVDLGWFTAFAYPLLKTLKWLYKYVNNYGIAIILLTLLIKIATFPLTFKSMKSMKNMAKLQPQIQKIREKYKDDKETLNREMLSLMKTHGYNPMAGCLPILIQMPIFFALYRVLYSSIELYHAPFFFWIQDLSSHDHFYVTPILLSATMFIQQKLTPNTATDPTQARMMQLMPLIFGAFMLTLPAGLTIYMLVNALAGIIQQVILNKKLDAKPNR